MQLNFSVGDLTVHRLVELVAPFKPALEFLPALTPELLEENRSWLQPHSLGPGDVFNLCYQSYIVRTPHHTILVNSGLGNDKPRTRPEWHMKSDDNWMRALAAAGLTVEDVDVVMCTHLQLDHVGWNTRWVDGQWVPTFPNARYVFGRRVYAATEAAHKQTENPVYLDSVLPIVRAGVAEFADDDYQLGDYVRAMPIPGHTEGQLAFCFGKGQDDAVVTGDLLHLPLQLRYPELSFVNDRDPVLAATTRRAFLERYCDTPTLWCTTHIPLQAVGRVKRWGEGYRLE
jgi:glyoxylase-like metal-dependent hydrolase (beta-lactamase superfamily II)